MTETATENQGPNNKQTAWNIQISAAPAGPPTEEFKSHARFKQKLNPINNNVLLIALSDGIGTSEHAPSASLIAVETALQSMEKATEVLLNPSTTTMRKTLVAGAAAAYNSITDRAAKEREPINNFQNTLALVIHMGDSLATIQFGPVLMLASTKNQSEKMTIIPGTTQNEHQYSLPTLTNLSDHHITIMRNDEWERIAVVSGPAQAFLTDSNNGNPKQEVLDQAFNAIIDRNQEPNFHHVLVEGMKQKSIKTDIAAILAIRSL